MDENSANRLSRLPTEMLAFTLKQAASRGLGPRVGTLLCKDRAAIETPHYVAAMSRGVIPHVSPDVLQKNTNVSVVYIPVEDFLEKSRTDAPIFHTTSTTAEAPIHKYIALPNRCVSILGPRRVPPLKCPSQNTHSSLAICTSVGFASLGITEYNNAAKHLRPDLALTAVDVVQEEKISVKRLEKSIDRTHAWLRDTITDCELVQEITTRPALIASIPPMEKEQQSFFLSDLVHEYNLHLSGVCIYSPASVEVVPIELYCHPRLCLTDPTSPHEILKAVSYGIDLISTPFVDRTSEHGIAFDFTFPIIPHGSPQPLGRDMWSSKYATSLTPLSPSCDCYTCTRHHRAYVHHLLQAREMLAWTLLQVHNFHILDKFFAAIRASIEDGTFEADAVAFNRAYQSVMPAQSGEGPRIRGYQTKSVGGGEAKKNPRAYGKLDDQLQNAIHMEVDIPSPLENTSSDKIAESSFVEKT